MGKIRTWLLYLLLGLMAGWVVGNVETGKLSHLGNGNSSEILQIPTPAVNNPERLVIDKLGVNAIVESVGLTERKAMDVPKERDNVAWYMLGAKPGELGSSVIAGHYDWHDGPAIFFELEKLQIGDTIEVLDNQGLVKKFSVSEIALYNNDEFPIEIVFARRDKVRLNLVTCDGVFNQRTNSYNEKLVIFSEAVE